MFENLKQEWEDTDRKVKYLIGALLAVGVVAMVYSTARKDADAKVAETQRSSSPPNDGARALTDPAYHQHVLPPNSRNQGLEDLTVIIDKLSSEVSKLRSERANGTPSPNASLYGASSYSQAPGSGNAGASSNMGDAALGGAVDLNQPLPGAVSFDIPSAAAFKRGADFKAPGRPDVSKSARSLFGAEAADSTVERSSATAPTMPTTPTTPTQMPQQRPTPAAKMKVWESEARAAASMNAAIEVGPLIPVNSALEAVMLSGINARPTGGLGASTMGAVGTATSANNVGAPFVSRIKGDAILPNSWKLSDLGDCFLGGSGIAVLSTERAYVIADTLSCVDTKGEVYESPVKAYGLDVDGTLGVAGKTVSKQGSILLRSALAGMASGLGSALAPTALPSYNASAVSGAQTGIQYPNPALVGYTAAGQGVNQAASQLSKFYLEYAREIFPVVEVVAGTRVTWILKESVTLKKKMLKGIH